MCSPHDCLMKVDCSYTSKGDILKPGTGTGTGTGTAPKTRNEKLEQTIASQIVNTLASL